MTLTYKNRRITRPFRLQEFAAARVFPVTTDPMSRIEINGLRVGASRISLSFRRAGKYCHVERLDVVGPPLRTDVELE
nr:hypothetical protein Hi04_10k_c2877_00002 [uncultured bacterium]